MTYEEEDRLLASKKSYVKMDLIKATPSEYIDFERKMINQGIHDKVHILSMRYDVSDGDLWITRRFFK